MTHLHPTSESFRAVRGARDGARVGGSIPCVMQEGTRPTVPRLDGAEGRRGRREVGVGGVLEATRAK